MPPTLVVRSYMYNRHWSSHSEDLRPSNLCRPLGLRAHANLTLDSPTQIDFLFHIDVCDRLAAVATIPPRWWESRHGTACDRRLWAVAGFVTSNTERPSPSAIRTTRWPSGFSKIVMWWRSGSANDQTAPSNVSRRVIARPNQSRNRLGDAEEITSRRCRLLRRRHLRSRRHRRSYHRRIQCQPHPTMRRPVPPPR
jgi:hypothetical protein